MSKNNTKKIKIPHCLGTAKSADTVAMLMEKLGGLTFEVDTGREKSELTITSNSLGYTHQPGELIKGLTVAVAGIEAVNDGNEALAMVIPRDRFDDVRNWMDDIEKHNKKIRAQKREAKKS